MRKTLIFIFIFYIVFLTACESGTRYEGDKYAFFTEAMHSLISCRGWIHGNAKIGPQITKIEEDDYGREFFLYYENYYYYMISQKKDDNYVYYYEDFNYVSCSDFHNLKDESIANLKDLNDWGRELDLGKCVKKSIIKNRKELEKKFDKSKIGEIINETYYNNFNIQVCTYITSNGEKQLILIEGYKEQTRTNLLLIINENYQFSTNCIYEIDDESYWLNDYQEDLREFKEKNKWYS